MSRLYLSPNISAVYSFCACVILFSNISKKRTFLLRDDDFKNRHFLQTLSNSAHDKILRQFWHIDTPFLYCIYIPAHFVKFRSNCILRTNLTYTVCQKRHLWNELVIMLVYNSDKFPPAREWMRKIAQQHPNHIQTHEQSQRSAVVKIAKKWICSRRRRRHSHTRATVVLLYDIQCECVSPSIETCSVCRRIFIIMHIVSCNANSVAIVVLYVLVRPYLCVIILFLVVFCSNTMRN